MLDIYGAIINQLTTAASSPPSFISEPFDPGAFVPAPILTKVLTVAALTVAAWCSYGHGYQL